MVRPSFTAQEIPNANMCVLAIFPTLVFVHQCTGAA